MTCSTLIRADRLGLAHLFISDNPFRFPLHGVHIEALQDGVRISATDGRRLAIFIDRHGVTGESQIIRLPREALRAIARIKPADAAWFAIMGQRSPNGRVEARVFNSALKDSRNRLKLLGLDEVKYRINDVTDDGVVWAGAVQILDGEFPDIGRVVPRAVPVDTPTPTVNGDYLISYVKVARSEDGFRPLRLLPGAFPESPILVDCARDDFVGVLMPMRADREGLMATENGEIKPPAWAFASPFKSKQRAAA